MKQYVFFDPETGRIAHVHQVVSAETGEQLAVDEEQLSSLVDRIVDLDRLAHVRAELPTASSRSHTVEINPRTGRVLTRRIPVRDRKRPTRAKGD